MNYSNELTELYHLMSRNKDQDVTVNGAMEAWLAPKLPSDFCNAVFVLGIELRDEDNIDYATVKRLIGIVERLYKEKEVTTDKLHIKYKLGLANMHLNPCTIDELTPEMMPILEDIVFNLKKCLIILDEIQPLAKGIMSYYVDQCFDYVFAALDKVRVDNNNLPIDLDSAYVFSDQLDSDDLWHELIRQIKAKGISPTTDITQEVTELLTGLVNNEDTVDSLG